MRSRLTALVAGTGGINDQAVPQATGQVTGDHTFVSSFRGYGYVLVTVDSTTIKATKYGVDHNTNIKSVVESFTINLKRSVVT